MIIIDVNVLLARGQPSNVFFVFFLFFVFWPILYIQFIDEVLVNCATKETLIKRHSVNYRDHPKNFFIDAQCSHVDRQKNVNQ